MTKCLHLPPCRHRLLQTNPVPHRHAETRGTSWPDISLRRRGRHPVAKQVACASFIRTENHCSPTQPRPAAPQPQSRGDREEKLPVKRSEASALSSSWSLAAVGAFRRQRSSLLPRRAPRSSRTPRDGVWGPDLAWQPRHRAPCTPGEARLMPHQHRLCLSSRQEDVEIHRQ